MRNGRTLLRWAGVLAATAIIGVGGFWSQGTTKALPEGPGEKRADLIEIGAMERFGKLDLPKVAFRHDQHTTAVTGMGKDCAACHKSKDGKMSLKFMRLDDNSAAELKEIYHANCIGCHTDLAKAGKKTGPQDGECRSCHNPKPSAASSWKEIGFDKSLHYRHVASKAIKPVGDPQKNCGACHHVYDEASKKLVWGKNKEDSCRACHGEKPVDKRPALDTAAHTACISCHMDVAKTKAETGPVNCAGCHAPEEQAKFKVVREVPRLDRGQPDAALILPVPGKDAPREMKGTMKPVAFDHKAHEAKANDCRTCHHVRIDTCTACHTVNGTADSKFVQLEKAMHQPDSMRSCVGCHNTRVQQPTCAGCHGFIKPTKSDAQCGVCHVAAPGFDAKQVEAGALLNLKAEQRSQVAASMLSARPQPKGTFDLNDIPEKVVIGSIAKEYQPSEFPHRKIVKTLIAGIGEDKLAATFHIEKGTLCQGCHHNSPASLTPPKCASCHGKPFDADRGDRPGLKAAYHQQCMGCHDRMKIEKPANTACVDCHKERAK